MADRTISSDPLVVLDDLHLTLQTGAGDVNILRGFAMTVARCETVAVVGPSGSGKSTMLAVMAGLERATSGRVTVAGHDLGALNEDALARFRRDHLGIVFQSFHLVPTMTAVENVAIPLELAGRHDAHERAAAGLHAVGAGHRLGHYPAQLSGGEQQRVALARAVVAEPELLLADEPTGNLDHATGETIIELLFATQARLSTTLVLVTHDSALAARCDRVIRVGDGRVVGEGAHAGDNMLDPETL
ncbi:MAG: ATP-binding cassette domain-containing protein [Alphaproteobacteria bacterium]